jgi:phospholipid/cholesterol/gamma-HCH transport system substrate-binding protein
MPSAQRVTWAKFRVLAVAVSALLILGTISYLLTGGSLFEPQATIYLYLDDATGLAAGSPVRVDGIGVGKVDTVELSGSNQPNRVVRVSMSVERDRLESIPVDSTAQSTSDNPIGDKFVDITSGVSAQHIPPGGEIPLRQATELMKSMDIPEFQKRLRVMGDLLDEIEQGRSPLGKFIAGEEMYDQLRDRIAQLQASMHSAADTTTQIGQALYTDALYVQIVEPLRQLDQSLAKLQSGQGSLGPMLRDTQQYEQARAQVVDLRKSIGDLHTGDVMTSDADYNSWIKQVTGIIQSVENFNANPMLTTTAVYDNLNGMAKEMQSTMKDFRGNPQKFLRLKIF